MFYSLVVVSLLLVSGDAVSDLDPTTEGEDEMYFAVVSSILSLSSIERYPGNKHNIKYVNLVVFFIATLLVEQGRIPAFFSVFVVRH